MDNTLTNKLLLFIAGQMVVMNGTALYETNARLTVLEQLTTLGEEVRRQSEPDQSTGL